MVPKRWLQNLIPPITSPIASPRPLRAQYTLEIVQDLKAMHGIDAEAELAAILSQEIIAEINREVIRTISSSNVRLIHRTDGYKIGHLAKAA